MLTSMDIVFEKNDAVSFSPHLGSLLHGIIVQQLNPAYAELMHANTSKPFSQFLYFNPEKKAYCWKINTITPEAKTQLLDVIHNNLNSKLFVDHKSVELSIKEKLTTTPVSYKQLADRYYIEQPSCKKIVVKFLTPTTIKAGKDHLIFPDIRLIYNSLLKRWNSFASDISLEDPDILDHLTKYTQLIGYDLKSTKFSLESAKIKSFRGEICLIVNGPESLVRIANLLFAFGEYSGVGSKNALGMGGIKVEQ